MTGDNVQDRDKPPRLTIVLPAKGRHLFTMRFLWHADKLRLPYRFLIADGQVNEAVARHVENRRETFPNLDIEYVRYPDDTNYSRYFAKMADALQRVRTPYAMWADNDDFLGVNGIEQALDFLDANADYACARGRVAAFAVYSGLGNPANSLHGRFNRFFLSGDRKEASSSTVAKRLREGGLCHGLFYAVYRTAALADILRDSANIDFSDLMLHENFLALRGLTFGKLRTSQTTITYFAQIGTSITYQPVRDWVQHLINSHFTSDLHALVERLASVAAATDGVGDATIAEDLRTMIEEYFRDYLWLNYRLDRQIKLFLRSKVPNLVNFLQNLPRLVAGRERRSMFSQLAAAGASSEDLNRTGAELAAIEATLSKAAFAEFVGPFRPMAHNNSRREWF
jgi:glycosyltransferase domain-containing protein